MMGIYEICNLHDGKATAYVGSTNNIHKRWGEHRARLRRSTHDNAYLQRAWLKYGEEAFAWNIIEEVQDSGSLTTRVGS